MNKFAITPLRLAALAALGVAAGAASAQQQPADMARVLAVQPAMQQVPVSDCGPYGRQPTGAGAAVGAVTGGLIGSQLGGGNGHIAGAILGAVGGAMVGNAAEASQPGGCVTRYALQPAGGYDVIYEYGGRQYSIRMACPPQGPWMQMPPAPNDGACAPPPPPAYGYGAAPPPGYPYPAAAPVPQGAYGAPPQGAYDAAPPDGADDAPPPPAGYPPPAYPPQAYPQPPYPPQAYPYPPAYPPPGYYVAPGTMRPAPVYVGPPVSFGLSVGGRTGRHSSVGLGIGIN